MGPARAAFDGPGGREGIASTLLRETGPFVGGPMVQMGEASAVGGLAYSAEAPRPDHP
jgi:hypothetical protein